MRERNLVSQPSVYEAFTTKRQKTAISLAPLCRALRKQRGLKIESKRTDRLCFERTDAARSPQLAVSELSVSPRWSSRRAAVSDHRGA